MIKIEYNDITANTLTAQDLQLVSAALTTLQISMRRPRVPAPFIYNAIKDKLSCNLTEAYFGRALSLALEAMRFPALKPFRGRNGGIGQREGTNGVESGSSVGDVDLPPMVVEQDLDTPLQVATETIDEMVQVEEKEIVDEITGEILTVEIKSEEEQVNEAALDENEELSFARMKEMAEAAALIKKEAYASAAEAVKAAKLVANKPSPTVYQAFARPGEWDAAKARAFLMAFAEIASEKEKVLVRARAEESSKTEVETRHLCSVAFGFDPGAKEHPFLNWKGLYVPIEKVENKSEEELKSNTTPEATETVEVTEVNTEIAAQKVA